MGFNINDILHGNVVQEQLVEEEEKVSEAVDYKMITFTLGGKDYAIVLKRIIPKVALRI